MHPVCEQNQVLHGQCRGPSSYVSAFPSSPAGCVLSLRRIGPLKLLGSTTLPFCKISSMPCRTRSLAASLVASISGRQSCGRSLRGISLGQHVCPGFRAFSISSATSRSCWSRPSPAEGRSLCLGLAVVAGDLFRLGMSLQGPSQALPVGKSSPHSACGICVWGQPAFGSSAGCFQDSC